MLPIGTSSRRWRATRTAHAGFVLHALEQALRDRRPARSSGLRHYSEGGSRHVSIKFSERLAEAGSGLSVGCVGDSYDNAWAETINGLYKADMIHRRKIKRRQPLGLQIAPFHYTDRGLAVTASFKSAMAADKAVSTTGLTTIPTTILL